MVINEPLLSVIVPVYGVEKYIGECLESIINQKYKNLEIIVINDGTKDGSADIAKKYAKQDARIKVYDFSNGGLSVARNRGLEKAGGEYIAFVDSDDWISPDMYSDLMTKMLEYQLDMIKCAVYEVDAVNKKKSLISFKNSGLLSLPPIDEHYFDGFLFTVVWNAIYTRKLAQNIKYPVNVIHEDNYASGMYLALAKKVMVVNKPYYNYRVNNSGISKGGVKRPLDKCIAVDMLIHDLMEQNVDLKKYYWRFACEVYHFLRGLNNIYRVLSIDRSMYIFLLKNLDVRRKILTLFYVKKNKIRINNRI